MLHIPFRLWTKIDTIIVISTSQMWTKDNALT